MIKMKLSLVTDHHLNSGIGRYSLELSKALIKQSHEVRLHTPYKENGDDVLFHETYDWISKIRYKSLRDLHPYLLPYFIAAQILGQRSDVYHAHWFMAGLGLLKAHKKRVVVTMHDVSLLHEKEKTGKFTNYYEKSLNSFKTKELPIIVVSNQAKVDALQYAGLSESQVHAIPNGINFEQFFPLEKSADEDIFKIVYAGGLSPRKNLTLLLEACKILEDRKIDYKLEIAGNHPDATPYPHLAQSLNLKHVHFVGFIPDEQMNAFYNAADLMVYTSKYEGFGFAPLEAMASGVPVISTKGGSLDEISGGGAHMISDDPEELATAIQHYISSENDRSVLAAKGNLWVQQYTWDKTATLTSNLYQKVAAL